MEHFQLDKRFRLLTLTIPIFVELSLRMLMGNIDTMMLSHYSDDSVAAVGVANQLLTVILLVFSLIEMGAAIVVAQYLGAKRSDKAAEAVVVALAVNIVSGLVLSGAVLLFGKQILLLLGLPAELLPYALPFLYLVGGLSVFEAISMTAGAMLRAYGYTRDAMFVTFGMNILNGLGNYLVLFAPWGLPVLGVEGVAMSTVFARLVAMVVLVVILYRRLDCYLPVHILRKFPRSILKNILNIGVPGAGENIMYNASQLVVTAFIATLGTEALTTKIYTQNIMNYSYLLALSVGQATQIQIGHLVGANEKELAYRTCLRSLKIAFISSFVVAGIIALFRTSLMGIFTDNPAIIALGSSLILIQWILEPGRTFNLVVISALRAAGDARFPVYMGILSMWGVSCLLSYLLGIWAGLGLIGIWIAFTLDEWLRGILMLWRWRGRKWQQMYMIEPAVASVKPLQANANAKA